MSGTSLDGIDVAEVTFTKQDNWTFSFGKCQTYPYPKLWQQTLANAHKQTEANLKDVNTAYTTYLAQVLQQFITSHKIQNLDAVCSHGHTIWHEPQKGITLQIGNQPQLANKIAQKVVCDFRPQDVSLGGQGAPLVPIGDAYLFHDYTHCLNLGGFANISLDKGGNRIAFDVVPVNLVCNTLAQKIGLPFDKDGLVAASGKVDGKLLESLNNLPYYQRKPPKSLGIEWVNAKVFPLLNQSKLSVADLLATYLAHVVYQIKQSMSKKAKVLVTGGGAHNKYLMACLRRDSTINWVLPSTTLIDYKEALIFGLLGVLKLRGVPNCLASVTGAAHDHSSGKIFLA